MDDYRWRARPVLIFAPSDQDDRRTRQRQAFAASRDGLDERDIVLIEVVGARVATIVGAACTMPAADLRARYGIGDDRFCILLVGKDGGVKLRSDAPVTTDDLFALIDAMPMRRQEMGEGAKR